MVAAELPHHTQVIVIHFHVSHYICVKAEISSIFFKFKTSMFNSEAVWVVGIEALGTCGCGSWASAPHGISVHMSIMFPLRSVQTTELRMWWWWPNAVCCDRKGSRGLAVRWRIWFPSNKDRDPGWRKMKADNCRCQHSQLWLCCTGPHLFPPSLGKSNLMFFIYSSLQVIPNGGGGPQPRMSKTAWTWRITSYFVSPVF